MSATAPTTPASRYATKRLLPVLDLPSQHRRRCCDKCGRPLTGARGHGWPTKDGKGIRCNHCEFPKSAPRPGQLHIPGHMLDDDFTRA